ncbi:MAG TPA: PTS transporter subunit EIIC [Clostridiales bacterium]|nr:PTS transporter subunit EIIC [Clostridiales bacterium]
MKYKAFCEQIIELVGGEENIVSVTNCMTRLRFKLKNRSLAKTEKIKELPDVIDVVSNEVAFQIIIGTQVQEISPELNELLGMKTDMQTGDGKKEKLATMALKILSESMSPILVPLIASGLLAGLLSVLSVTGLVSAESSTYQLLEALRTSVFYFLPVFIAFSFSKRLGVNEYISVALAVTLLSTGINGVEGLDFLGIGLLTITYSNSFFPIILSIVFMKFLGNGLNKIIPKGLQYFINPMLSLIITLPITLILFGPLGNYMSGFLNIIFGFLSDTFGSWIVVMMYAALQPFLIMMGAGNFIIPIFMNSYATLGYDPVFTTAWVISDIAVCGAVFGYFLKTKDMKQRQLFGATAFSAFMGVTEPAIYGVFVKYRRPFIAVMIGGGLGGLFAGIMKVIGYAPVSILGITSFIGDNNYRNFYMMVIAVVIGFAGSMIAAYILGIPKDEVQNTKETKKETNKIDGITTFEINAPVKGKKVALNEVNDNAFSSSALGKGIGIIPEDTVISAPVSGEVISLFPTNHAIGIRTEYGVEVLIHIGIDTVRLEGKYFTSKVKQGDKVMAGDSLIEVDFDNIIVAGYDPVVITIVTNTADYLDVVPTNVTELKKDDCCITVII